MATRKQSFADRLKALREASQLTQQELADRAGLAQGAVSMLERGDRKPSLATAKILATALGVSLDELAK